MEYFKIKTGTKYVSFIGRKKENKKLGRSVILNYKN